MEDGRWEMGDGRDEEDAWRGCVEMTRRPRETLGK
jgi:hypothetical protein